MYGDEIDKRIKELGKSNQEVADIVGVNHSEIIALRKDRRQATTQTIFLKLMEYLELNPLDFGGFVRLDLKNEDEVNGKQFLADVKRKIMENKITIIRLAKSVSFSETQLRRILSGEQSRIKIDNLASLCEFLDLNYFDYLIDARVVPSFYEEKTTADQKMQLEELRKIVVDLDTLDLQKLIDIANGMQEAHKKRTRGL